jgi:endoglucanase
VIALLALAASLAAAQAPADAPPAAPPRPPSAPASCPPAPWPHFARYVEAFVSSDGRVIDRTDRDRTTSEGQAYALFFALVANERPLFERILRWTDDNLAGSHLGERLPAWHWGKRKDGSWGVVDANSASDADLWMGYALLEAGRLWSEPRFSALAHRLLATVAKREVVSLPGRGPTLLPAPQGFAVDGGRAWRLNPSYVPPQLLRRVAAAEGAPWDAVLASAVRLVKDSARGGVVADWVLYGPRRGFAPDPVKGGVGSYDAIRSYLWVGMLPADDPARRELTGATGGLLRLLAERGGLPEKIDARSLRGDGHAPVGFYAALLPLSVGSAPAATRTLEERVAAAAKGGLYGDPPTYYDQNLVLFARGFTEGRYRFAADGALVPSWEARCDGPRP